MSTNVRKIFAEVPGTYELVNRVLTLGLDGLWRRRAARLAASAGGTRWLDVCSGTGDMAAELTRLSRRKTRVFAADFSPEMIARARAKPELRRVRFSLAEVKALPFPPQSFDLVTISFATRNINVSREALLQSLREFHRVLKPGGRFVNLETSQPSDPLFRWLVHLYVKLLVKPVGRAISGSRAGYDYLASSIPRFYGPREFAEILREAGFGRVQCWGLFGGVAAIHRATR